MSDNFSIIEINPSENPGLVIELTQKFFSDLAETDVVFNEEEIDKIISDMPPPGKLAIFSAIDDSGRHIGFISLYESYSLFGRGNYGIINETWVERNWRNHSVGSALLERAVSHGRAKGWKRIDVTAPSNSEQARRFYEKTGFTMSGFKLKLVE